MIKTRMALAVALVMSTASAAFAEDGARLHPGKRYLHGRTMQSAPMSVNQSRNTSAPNSNLMMNVMDRASSPFACGG
jgi:hypothetical protein